MAKVKIEPQTEALDYPRLLDSSFRYALARRKPSPEIFEAVERNARAIAQDRCALNQSTCPAKPSLRWMFPKLSLPQWGDHNLIQTKQRPYKEHCHRIDKDGVFRCVGEG